MERKEKLLEKAGEIIDKGQKPHVELLSQELGFHPSDVHRILNGLERERKLETYTREIMGKKKRMVALKR